MRRKRILIVEDDPDIMLGYQVLLQAKNFESCFAAAPMEGLTAAHLHRPDLILLDLGLRGGDGFEAMKMLKAAEHLESIPIVVVSGREAQVFSERALQAGADAYFQKPADTQHLLGTISRLVEKTTVSGSAVAGTAMAG